MEKTVMRWKHNEITITSFSAANDVIVKKLENVSLLSNVTFKTLIKKM